METWDLTPLYSSLNSAEFTADLQQCIQQLKVIQIWCNKNLGNFDNPIDKIEYYVNFANTFGETLSRLSEYCQLLLSTDAQCSQALKKLDIIEELDAESTSAETRFTKWVFGIDNIALLAEKSTVICEHIFYINELQAKGNYTLSEKEELAIAKMRSTGSLSWTKLWEAITSTTTVSLRGEKHPLPVIRNMAYSNDPSLREDAYRAELEALGSIATTAAYALNSIKGEVITTSKMRGFSSPLEMTLFSSRLDKPVLDIMIKTMKDYLPIFRDYLKKKATSLGHKNGLPFYELFAPIGKTNMEFTYEKAKSFIIENFNSFSIDLGNYAETAFNNNWLDVYPKEGKRGGAFCANLHSIKESRFLINFTGTLNDVLTIAHELGHGYHGHCLNSQTHLNSDYPMPIAETASTFCETLVKNAALKKADIREQKIILENDISDNLQIIVDILSRFIFEDMVFEKRKEGPLSAEELCQLMVEAQKETYGDAMDESALHQYMWVVKPHYYDADYNYYNFPYAFGLLFAKGLYSIFSKKGTTFSEDYIKLLSVTGKNNHRDIALTAGIDILDEKFWEGSMEIIKADIEKYNNLTV